MIEIHGVPFDLCGKRTGSRLGPEALRLAGLRETLAALGAKNQDFGDLDRPASAPPLPGLKNFAPYAACMRALQERTLATYAAGRTPLILGGDHSIAVGGISAALRHFGSTVAVLWIDAHADLNTPGTSPSGDLHGMPLAALMGLPAGVQDEAGDQWDELTQEIVGPVKLLPARTGWLGLRDVDTGERALMRGLEGELAISMHDLDRHGMAAEVARVDAWLRASGAKQLWISFDVDALDPMLAPGTGTAVRGGLSYREAHLCAEMLREMLDASDAPYTLAGLEIVETNPLTDLANQTATMAVEWAASLFGRTILGAK